MKTRPRRAAARDGLPARVHASPSSTTKRGCHTSSSTARHPRNLRHPRTPRRRPRARRMTRMARLRPPRLCPAIAKAARWCTTAWAVPRPTTSKAKAASSAWCVSWPRMGPNRATATTAPAVASRPPMRWAARRGGATTARAGCWVCRARTGAARNSTGARRAARRTACCWPARTRRGCARTSATTTGAGWWRWRWHQPGAGTEPRTPRSSPPASNTNNPGRMPPPAQLPATSPSHRTRSPGGTSPWR